QCVGNRLRLDGRSDGIALGLEGTEDRLGEPKVSKLHVRVLWGRCAPKAPGEVPQWPRCATTGSESSGKAATGGTIKTVGRQLSDDYYIGSFPDVHWKIQRNNEQ